MIGVTQGRLILAAASLTLACGESDSQPSSNGLLGGGGGGGPSAPAPMTPPSTPSDSPGMSNGGTPGAGMTGGQPSTGGASSQTGGQTATGGSSAGGSSAQGGSAQGGSAQGGTAQGGQAEGGAAQGGDASGEPDERPWFSFFTTSEAGIRSLAPDKENGFGGDLGGLAGADEICATLAKRSNPGDNKVWRAFLSVTDDGNGNPVHAIERVGNGPWYDFNERLLAMDVAGLTPQQGQDGGRPNGADPQLAEMFTDENGDPVSPDTMVVDNHDVLTGSDRLGRLMGGLNETCQDWTSKDGAANGRPAVGHAWPRSNFNGRHWMSEHPAGGCAAGIDTTYQTDNGTNTVGSGGGYGGLFCFALSD